MNNFEIKIKENLPIHLCLQSMEQQFLLQIVQSIQQEHEKSMMFDL
jgi:hypothetical protein